MQRRFSGWRLGVVGVSLLLSMAWAEAAATGTVKGSVARDGGPLVGARVVIDSTSDSGYGAVTNTDEDGRFTFSNAPLGAVSVKVYDSQERLLVSGDGVLEHADEVINLALTVTP